MAPDFGPPVDYHGGRWWVDVARVQGAAPGPRPPRRTSIRIKVVSDIHGAADELRREAADADALLVCGDLVNLLDYRTLDGVVAEVYGRPAVERFLQFRNAGRFDEAGGALRAAGAGREAGIRAQIRASVRA